MTTLQAQLPPSPPPSPPRQRKHKKKHNADPFSDLSTPLPSPSPPSSPHNEEQEPQDSLITRIILTPILFTSFLISLFLVDRSDRLRRTASHPSKTSSSSLLSYFSPSAWLDPEPYQDPDNAKWERRDTGHVEPHSALNPEGHLGEGGPPGQEKEVKRNGRKWFLRKKIRKMARLEISDALEMRGRVIVMMVSVVVMCVGAIFLGLKWMVNRLWW